MKTDLEIAREAKMLPIDAIAEKAGFLPGETEHYGHYKAKISNDAFTRLADRPDGKLVLVTAVNPTPAGEGKTTTTIGLGDAIASLGENIMIAIREPSLGPVFGVKGGAAGGGYAQVIPMEDINLHFTGDIHAITAANNLLCAMVDNHLFQGNVLGIDPERVVFPRALDMNDRALRSVTLGVGGGKNGVEHHGAFLITAASEIMAILCLAEDMADLKRRLGRIICAYTYEGKPVTASDLKADGAMAALLREAMQPNLVQTLAQTPTLVHGGPFANIAHGCNTVRATKLALKAADIVITEAGFGADLGAEKFFDIKCRTAGLKPSAVVLVVTARALKYNGGVAKEDLKTENVAALKAGLPNLAAHVENLKKYGIPVVAAINRFYADTEAELAAIFEECDRLGVPCALSDAFARGGEGTVDLAKAVLNVLGSGEGFRPLYSLDLSLTEKLEALACNFYGADGIEVSEKAAGEIAVLEGLGFGKLPVCVAKTQYSLSDDPAKLCRPSGFKLHVNTVRVSAGAGFVVAETGSILTMPGLPKVPAAEGITTAEDGTVDGLF